MRDHLTHTDRQKLTEARVIIHEEFNKSACLDLESKLIAWLHADRQYSPLNRNDGQQSSHYFERFTRYQPIFDAVFEQLKSAGLFSRPVSEIENLNLFKLSPYKTLNDDQLVAVESIVEDLFTALPDSQTSTGVVQGGPGTGKTIVAIYLLKLLSDIQNTTSDPDPEEAGRFNEYFTVENRNIFKDLRVGFVVPQQSLRTTIQKVFKRTPGLSKVTVLSPYTVGASEQRWDLLIVDEAHRLTHRGSGPTRGAFKHRSQRLFGDTAATKTAIDWIVTQSDHQIFLVDGEQTVRPADVSSDIVKNLIKTAQNKKRFYTLESQMRVAAGEQYLEFCRNLLTDNPSQATGFTNYDLRFFDDLELMQSTLKEKETETGLSRLLAGYAWAWNSQNDKAEDAPYDIEIGKVSLRWNRTATDWIASNSSFAEVGSVHTVQGYDLNYAGVIIGPDIVWDEEAQTIRALRKHHFDREVRSVKDDQELLNYIKNAYYVLLTRGIRGTYVYVTDPPLRERIRALFSSEILPPQI